MLHCGWGGVSFRCNEFASETAGVGNRDRVESDYQRRGNRQRMTCENSSKGHRLGVRFDEVECVQVSRERSSNRWRLLTNVAMIQPTE